MKRLLYIPVYSLVLVGLMAISACSVTDDPELTLEANMLAACQGFSNALRTANVLEPQMTEPQREAVDQAVDTAVPACHSFRESGGTTAGALDAVREALRRIVLANQEVQEQ